jgi:hypothetical protein
MNSIEAAVQKFSSEIRDILARLGRLLVRGLFQRTDLEASIRNVVHTAVTQAMHEKPANLEMSQISQINLMTHYKSLTDQDCARYNFDDIGFKCHSQNSEDGILLYIFSIIGTTNKIAVEICAGNGIECNAANLIINHGWWALLFDGGAANIAAGTQFFQTNPRSYIRPPCLVEAWITRDNVNDLIRQNHISGEIDLLSIDVDGNDYWIWNALDVISPRVVIVECQANNWGAERAVTIPYQEDFLADFSAGGETYCGASLPAMVNLGRRKGYRLVGVERYGFNAFFIRNDIQSAFFPEKSAEQCLQKVFKTFTQSPPGPSFLNRPWQDV